MTRLVFLSFLGFLSGFFLLQPQARIPYFPIPLATPLRPLTRLVLGPPPALSGEPVVTCALVVLKITSVSLSWCGVY